MAQRRPRLLLLPLLLLLLPLLPLLLLLSLPLASARSPLGEGVVYLPDHNWEFPVLGGPVDAPRLRAAIDRDLELLSAYFTHIRTLAPAYYGIDLAPLAHKHGLRVLVGVPHRCRGSCTSRDLDTRAVAAAIREHPDAVRAVVFENADMFGSPDYTVTRTHILEALEDIARQITEIQRLAGPRSTTIDFGIYGDLNWILDGTESPVDARIRELTTTFTVFGGALRLLPDPTPGENLTSALEAKWNEITARLPPNDLVFTEIQTNLWCYKSSQFQGLPRYNGSGSTEYCMNSAMNLHEAVFKWSPLSRPGPWLVVWDAAFDRHPTDFKPRYSDGLFTMGRERKLPDLPRPRQANRDPIALPSKPYDVRCPLGMYDLVVYENRENVRLCALSGHSFWNPAKFDELSLRSACENPFCHLVVNALRNVSQPPPCPFDDRMPAQLLDTWILEPFGSVCKPRESLIVEYTEVNPSTCTLSHYITGNFLAVVHDNGTVAEQCPSVGNFSLSAISEGIGDPSKRVALSQAALEAMCFRPSCELRLLQMSDPVFKPACFLDGKQAREWIVSDILVPYFDGCYEPSTFATEYYDITYRRRRRQPRLPSSSPSPSHKIAPSQAPLPGPLLTPTQNSLEDDESSSASPEPSVLSKRQRRTKVPALTSSDIPLMTNLSIDAAGASNTTPEVTGRDRKSPSALVPAPTTIPRLELLDDDFADGDSATGNRTPTLHRQSLGKWLVVGIVSAFAVVLSVVMILCRRTRRQSDSYVTMSARSSELCLVGGSPRTASWPTDNPRSVLSDPQLTRLFIPQQFIRDVRLIGSGGQALVYLVEFCTTGPVSSRGDDLSIDSTLLAAKRLSKHHATTDSEAVIDFINEIKLVASLHHPNIVRLIGATWTTGHDIQALFEFMADGDLCSHLSTTARCDWDAAKLQLALDVVEALAYVHSLDPPLVHRDVKSRNVLLAHVVGDARGPQQLRAKLTDFGVSRRHSNHQTMTTGVGTSRWLAPEVILGGGDYDQSCDIYSFGVLLSELDTHQLPFTDRRTPTGDLLPALALLEQIASEGVRPGFTPWCPRELQEIADACLSYDPSRRPSAQEVCRRLRGLMAGFCHAHEASRAIVG